MYLIKYSINTYHPNAGLRNSVMIAITGAAAA